MQGLVARRRQSLAFFGLFRGFGTAYRQESEVASNAELIVVHQFTP